MITHIRMKNFKSWKDSGEVELAPLTGFFGTNSSGKSSLLQMLLLLKQTVENSEIEDVIFFGDETSRVNMGNLREVIHGHDLEEQLGLEFGCQLNEALEIRVPRGGNLQSYPYSRLNVEGFTFETAICDRNGEASVESICYHIKSNGISNLSEVIKWEGHRLQYGNQSEIVRFVKNCYRIPKSSRSRLSESLEGLFSAFENLFAYIYYIGPIRAEPQRQYHWNEMRPESVGQTGNMMIDALLVSRANQQKTFHKGKIIPIERRISEWLKEMDLAYSFSLEPTSGQKNTEYNFRIQKSPNSAKVTLTDMGYGLSQFLPVLVGCYYAQEGSTLILEQPGIHLHPKVQSQLADLLIEVVTERKLQILVESHSEHLLNRLQRRIAEEKISVDQTALHFCQNNDGVSTIDPLKMDKFGNIENWPPNFFGNEIGDLFAMTEAQRERQKRSEG